MSSNFYVEEKGYFCRSTFHLVPVCLGEKATLQFCVQVSSATSLLQKPALVPVVAKQKKSKGGFLLLWKKKKKVKSQNSVQYLFGSKPSCYGGSVHRNSQSGPAKLLPGTTLSISASSPIALDCVSICASTLCILLIN